MKSPPRMNTVEGFSDLRIHYILVGRKNPSATIVIPRSKKSNSVRHYSKRLIGAIIYIDTYLLLLYLSSHGLRRHAQECPRADIASGGKWYQEFAV